RGADELSLGHRLNQSLCSGGSSGLIGLPLLLGRSLLHTGGLGDSLLLLGLRRHLVDELVPSSQSRHLLRHLFFLLIRSPRHSDGSKSCSRMRRSRSIRRMRSPVRRERSFSAALF